MLVLPPKLTHAEAPACLYMLQQGLAGKSDTSTVVDASALAHFDSSALAVLLECRRLAQAWGKAFSVRQPPGQLAALAKLYGVDQLLFAEPAAAA